VFEDYLEDARDLASRARQASAEREAKRYYRASVFYAVGAIEAFVNYVGDTFAQGGSLQPYEVAFLTDRKFDVVGARFEILEEPEYHRVEDKLKFVISKFIPTFDFQKTASWSRLLSLKRFRDRITHPRGEEDEVPVPDYERTIRSGLSSTIEIMDLLCKGIFRRPLRKKLLDLRP